MSADEPKRIGIMGGTFDPIHIAHLVCAEEAFRVFSLDVVLFVPTGNPSFKQGSVCASPLDRLNMVELAIASNPHFEASRMEVDREGVTYTIDTLKELHRVYPESELFFITGADAISSIATWYGAHDLPRLATYIAARRPGYVLEADEGDVGTYDLSGHGVGVRDVANKDAVSQDTDSQDVDDQNAFSQDASGHDAASQDAADGLASFHIEYLEVPQIGVSSTMLRRRIAAGKSVRYLIPGPAYTYLMNRGLYASDSKGDVRI